MRYLIFLLGFIFIVSCKDSRKGYQATEAAATEVALNETSDPGRKIVENECYICHNPMATEASMIAPPLVAVKRHYIDEQTSEEEFTEALINWLSDPQVETSRMRGALRRFGVMPYQPYSEEAIRDIASYIYNSELPQPEWFEEHFQKGHGRGKGMQMGKKSMQMGEDESYSPLPSYYKEKGMEVVMAAQGVLGKKLMTAIQERGPEGAIAFCKAEATGLTDSVGIMKNTVVKRVTDKPRNTANRATDEEVGFMIAFKRQVENNGEIRPITKEMNEDEVYFYYPIVTNAMCLQCHGTPNKEITPAVNATLASLYPKDEATGYDVQQVRGMWRIEFIKEK